MTYHETATESFWLLAGLAEMMAAQLPEQFELLAGLAEMMAAQLPEQFERERAQRRIDELMARVTAAGPKPTVGFIAESRTVAGGT